MLDLAALSLPPLPPSSPHIALCNGGVWVVWPPHIMCQHAAVSPSHLRNEAARDIWEGEEEGKKDTFRSLLIWQKTVLFRERERLGSARLPKLITFLGRWGGESEWVEDVMSFIWTRAFHSSAYPSKQQFHFREKCAA